MFRGDWREIHAARPPCRAIRSVGTAQSAASDSATCPSRLSLSRIDPASIPARRAFLAHHTGQARHHARSSSIGTSITET
ncbi:hypothetical protein BGLA2_2200022 [Burkholderia gladioli]|nr:hypothetical protein BGLA2_2200022 [Burkholderia gladioli]